MYSRLSLDVETRSACDLVKSGAHKYARDPTTDVLVACYAFDDEPPRLWRQGDPCPKDLADYVTSSDGPIWAFNAPFELSIWQWVLAPRHGWPVPPLERWYCTASMAAAMALPRKLGDVVKALGLDEEKDDAGRRVMMQLSRPRSREPLTWWERADVPKKFAHLETYCANDVVIERAAAKRLHPLSAEEREIWLENCRMNERGVPIDTPSVHAALTIVGKEIDKLNAELARLTRHRVSTVNQVALLSEWLREQGVDVESLDKAHLREALTRDLPANVRRALEIRQEAAKSSTAKLRAMLSAVCDDGKVRGTIRYHGASTGRDSGELLQTQNFPRSYIKPAQLDAVFDAIQTRDPRWLELWGSPLTVISWSLRGMIAATGDNLIYSGDLSNIEGRVAAWLGDEQWKLDAFQAYDEGWGPDLYKVSASGTLGIPIEAIGDDSDERQVGKTNELSLQFQGSHGAFITMAANYGITPQQIAPVIERAADPAAWAAAAEKYDPKNRYDLPEREWVALRVTIDGWRASHPGIVGMWGKCETAAVSALQNPGTRFTAGRLAFAYAGGILWCQLPDGKRLSYVAPQMREVDTPWGQKKHALTYMSLNSMTRQYERTKSYGGLIFQNSVQGIARQIIKKAQLRFKARGWPVLFPVHDELVCMLPADTDLAEFRAELAAPPGPGLEGIPISAKAVKGKRYGK